MVSSWSHRIAHMVPAARRASTYGVLDTGDGLAWFAGSALMGLPYDVSLRGLILFSVAIQLAAVPILLGIQREFRRSAPP